MTIYKRKGVKVYRYDFYRNGERFCGSTGVRVRRDAEVIENALKTQIAMKAVGIEAPRQRAPVPTFTKAIEGFLEWSAVEHAEKPATNRRYQVSSKALLRFFGDQKLNRIDVGDIESFKDWRRVQQSQPKKTTGGRKPKPTNRIKPATVNRELACLKALFTFYRRRKVVSENPVSDVKMLAEERTFHILTPEQEEKYLAECGDPLYDIAVIAVETGMRPDDIYGMRIDDIHLAKGYYFNQKGKTAAARRRVPLTERAQEIISLRLPWIEGQYLFPGNVEGRHIVKVNAAHAGALRRSGLPKFRLYDLRHTFATRFVESGGDLVTLAQILGHADLRMVMVYSHPTDPHKQASIRRFEAYTQASRTA